jgi:RNA polymerase sigma factor (sigma-70 family)
VHNQSSSPDDLFAEAYAIAHRSAYVRSVRAIRILRVTGVDAVDLVQESLIGVYLALGHFDPLRASLRTFIETVVAGKITSVIRRAGAKKRTRPADFALAITPSEILVKIELRVDIRRALKRLNTRDQRVALLLVHQKPTDVALILGISRPAVYRSIDRIRRVLEEAGYK